MTRVKATQDNKVLAGMAEWKQSLRIIKDLEIQFPLSADSGFRDSITGYFLALLRLIITSSRLGEYLQSDYGNPKFTLKDLLNMQEEMNLDLRPNSGDSGYNKSYANPQVCCKHFETDLGLLLCMLYARYRNYPALLIQKRYTELAKLNRLFLDLYELAAKQVRSGAKYSGWHKAIVRDITSGMEAAVSFNLDWKYSPGQNYYKNIIMQSDLTDLRYLFRYGIYVSKEILALAEFMNSYPERELLLLSQYIVNSYQEGFIRGNRSYQTKRYATLIIPAGMERLGRMLIADLHGIGLEAVVAQPIAQSYNKQYEYDHRFSMAVYYDRGYADKYLQAYEKAVGGISKCLQSHAGPVYIEVFGEVPFTPSQNPFAFRLSDEQKELLQQTTGQTSQMFYQHYRRAEKSFCIIAFPSPEIGPRFREIFADTVKLNLLDSMKYAHIQQKIIDVLDAAEFVHVKGKRGNATDIMVHLHKLKNPLRETNFENCVADVNIPVGEVFTSPLLKGTNGVLHVKDIYLHNLRFKNLKLTFKDGMITDYTCSNFRDEGQNRRYVEENLLMPHKSLPIGEFAIGTNTLAYLTAHKYKIQHLLPILIIEKMGPHFAVGDTCYSREEDIGHYNFVNGKKIIAVDNEKSALRKKKPLLAYTQVHTDITLPYDMLQSIAAIGKDGSRVHIIKDGLFAVPGTEELNEPLLEISGQGKKAGS